jgi:hypothetical protein
MSVLLVKISVLSMRMVDVSGKPYVVGAIAIGRENQLSKSRAPFNQPWCHIILGMLVSVSDIFYSLVGSTSLSCYNIYFLLIFNKYYILTRAMN